MKIYVAVSYWQTGSCSCRSVFYGTFEQCLNFVIRLYLVFNSSWSIYFGERLVARSSHFRIDYNDLY